MGRRVAEPGRSARRRALLFPALLALAMALALSPASAAVPDTSGIVYAQRLGGTLPLDARFTDQAGRPVALRDLTGAMPTVLALGYFACPGLCGLIRDDLLAALARTGLHAGVDYQLIFLSIDPAETPADAAAAWRVDRAAYPAPGAEQGWRYLTGRRQDIASVEQAVGYRSRYDPALKQFIHPAGLVFVSPSGVICAYLLGLGYRPGDVRAALVRARSGGIARAALPVLLVCFHFDSTTGRYTLAIAKLLRLAGGVTVLMIAALLLLLRRHGKKRISASGSPP